MAARSDSLLESELDEAELDPMLAFSPPQHRGAKLLRRAVSLSGRQAFTGAT
jgi:hypothetical protein